MRSPSKFIPENRGEINVTTSTHGKVLETRDRKRKPLHSGQTLTPYE